ncbi:Solute carrier family 40 member 2 [Phytophthora ramorum]|uniref:Solute carrier family 40 member 2 n=1 Tax=Phytophthora ramorum TaxID=164328 RepID=UPI0030A5050D|nr:Solute carrier family 40 member 2 [Phytophthora ramorum]
MEPTVFACVSVGVASLLLVLDGAACLLNVENACFATLSSSIVMLIIGTSTLTSRRKLDCCNEQQEVYPSQLRKQQQPRRVLVYLYAGHLLSAWGDRMWEFAVPILFMEIFVDTLLPSACFSLVMYATCLVAIPAVGRQLDAVNRWQAMRLAILLENTTIIVSTALLGAMLLLTDADGLHKPEWTWSLTLLFVSTLVCGGVGQVLSEAQTLGIERDWVVIIAQSSGVERSSALASLNTILRRIDLACKLLGPLAFGIIMDFAGRDPTTRAMIGASTVAIWNGLSTPLEYFMTRDIYQLVPELASKEEDPEPATSDEPQKQAEKLADGKSTVSRYAAMWRNYSRHPVFLLSFSYCSLYMTILDNGSLNTAYLKWRGVPDSLLGSSRGAGAVFGLLGTVLFPYLRRIISRLERVAVVSIWLFWLFLAPVLVAFLLAGESRVSDYVMLCCMVGARVWLWSADLAETQIMQEWIEPSRRGAINAMQTATYQLFYMLIQAMGVVFHDPRQFEALVFFSVATVLAAAVGFTLWDVRFGRHRTEHRDGYTALEGAPRVDFNVERGYQLYSRHQAREINVTEAIAGLATYSAEKAATVLSAARLRAGTDDSSNAEQLT